MMRERLTLYVKAAELTQRAATSDILTSHALTYAQLSMMIAVVRTPGMSNAALARLHGVTPQSAAETISALVKRGWVTREPDPSHSKILQIVPTEAGLASIEAAETELDAIELKLTAGISRNDLAVTRRTLRAVVRNGKVFDTTTLPE